MLKKTKIEYGDFQTPLNLARDVCDLLVHIGVRPQSILEPTCGKGSFLKASLECFTAVEMIVGLEINYKYVKQAQGLIENASNNKGKI